MRHQLVQKWGLELARLTAENARRRQPLTFGLYFKMVLLSTGILVAYGSWAALMALSATAANDIANYLCRGTAPTALTTPIKLSLHTADPGATGASEVTGGSYARQSAGYNTASGGACALAGTVSFTGMPASSSTHLGIWDSTGTPKFLQGAALSATATVSAGGTVNVTSATDTVTGTG